MINNVLSYSLEETGLFGRDIIRYLNEDPVIRPYYHYSPSFNGLQKAIADKQQEFFNRDLISDVIQEQYRGISPLPIVTENIERLKNDHTFTVCTGHQLCLFTGPLYFIYKIISTINLATSLNRQHPHLHVVPVYWMASEDHDYAEVNHVHVYGKKIEWIKKQEESGAVGRLSTIGIENAIHELAGLLGESEQALKWIQLLKTAYTKHPTLAEATRYLVNELFGKYGLVIIDGDHPKLKASFKDIIKKEIFSPMSPALVNQTIDRLTNDGIKIQVTPREINFFYLKENLRERIEKKEDKYIILNTNLSFSKEELENETEQHPERFSPNVVTRPLYQQHLLPNLAYVGGPNEILYWLEYKSLFEHFNMKMPVLWMRNSGLLLDKNAHNKLEKLNLEVNDVFRETESLIKHFVSTSAAIPIEKEEPAAALKIIYEQLSAAVIQTDPGLKTMVAAEMQKTLNGLDTIYSKWLKAEKQKNETAVQQLKKIKEKLFPDGEGQERIENLASYYTLYGQEMIDTIKNRWEEMKNEFSVVILI